MLDRVPPKAMTCPGAAVRGTGSGSASAGRRTRMGQLFCCLQDWDGPYELSVRAIDISDVDPSVADVRPGLG